MKFNPAQITILFLMLGALSLIYMGGLLSVTETHCSSQGVWLKFSLEDELSTIQNQIVDCAEDPAGGWVGSMMVYVTTPQGNEYNLGGYTTTKDSSEKMSCGGGYTGKYFVGSYVPNEGQGKYEMKAVITSYASANDYGIPYTFQFTRPAFAYCPTYKDKCEDGTLINSCSSNKPYYCDKYGSLNSQPSRCGCPNGLIAEGTQCVAPPAPTPPATTDCSGSEKQTQTCSDGSVITLRYCSDGSWKTTSEACPTNLECTSGQIDTTLCSDGSSVTSAVCENNKWKTVSYTCAKESPIDPTLILYGLAGVLFLGGIAVLIRRR